MKLKLLYPSDGVEMPSGVYPRTEEHNRKNSEGQKKHYQEHPERAANHSKDVIRYYQEHPEARLVCRSLGMLGKHPSEETKQRIGVSLTGRTLSKKHIQHMRYPKSEKHRQNFSTTHNRIDVKTQNTRNSLQTRARNGSLKMTGLEIEVESLLPDTYRFIGLGDFIIAGKCPDFVNESERKVVEAASVYWNEDDKIEAKVALFAEYGYQTLVIWDCELEEDIEMVKDRIRLFVNNS